MPRDRRYDILFEPIRISSVTAPNRFYQAPHCNGMGRLFPDAMIAMRGMKAEGVVDRIPAESNKMREERRRMRPLRVFLQFSSVGISRRVPG